jgi:endonuclease YncB( thermonuclease family)
MEDAEARAREARLGVWGSRGAGAAVLAAGVPYEVRVVDIASPVTLSVQLQSDALRAVVGALATARQPAGQVLKGDLVAAVSEGKLYRGRIVGIEGKSADVELIDLGIVDSVALTDLRVLPSGLAEVPPQGLKVRLGGVRAFRVAREFEQQAMDYLWGLCEGASLYLHLMYEDDLPGVLLTDSESIEGGSLNLMLITEGYVRVYGGELDPPFDALMNVFGETEEVAKAEKKGAWAHGNLGDEGDDDEDY